MSLGDIPASALFAIEQMDSGSFFKVQTGDLVGIRRILINLRKIRRLEFSKQS